MYNLNDTIVAVSSPSFGARSIVRITGPSTIEICEKIFSPTLSSLSSCIINGCVAIDNGLEIDAILYLFFAPHSYTGDDVAEIHIFAGAPVTESLMGNLLTFHNVRTAGPGEFTARAFLNGKIDLAQAEAVNEVIVSSNTFQLAAARKLLSGHLGQTTKELRSTILDCMSLLEAGLDFSDQAIEFLTADEAIERLMDIKGQFQRLLSESRRLASVVDLPSVGIAGATNAGKSSLLNRLLGTERSIVSHERKTTRDVLAGELTLRHSRCVLFDCAGLLTQTEGLPAVPSNDSLFFIGGYSGQAGVLDQLAQQAAFEALRNSTLVVFCTDISKENWIEETAVLRFIEPKSIVPIATKSDLVSQDDLASRLRKLNELFGVEFLPTSAKSGAGMEKLRDTIDREIIAQTTGSIEDLSRCEFALTARHRQAVTESIESIDLALEELKAGRDEIAAMMLRAAYQAISAIEQSAMSGVDEQILQNIFSRFCVGK
jgi:tRNA modification GTPase